MASQNSRNFRDSVHDYISFSPRVCAFIDTPQFQRLRSIKQLAACYYVWSGASHNRFEHCLGVAHLARLVATHVKDTQPTLGISDRDVECIQLAGLCHDLGHGPWSHAFDGLFIPKAKPGCKWHHEDGSEMMLDYLVKDNDIDITEKDLKFIKALIAGDHARCPDEKRFLFDIVANKRNGIDVDKFDYMMRDGYHLGQQANLSITRLIEGARVIDNQICYRIKDANQLYELCWTRFSFHKQYYTHKTSRAIEYMIVDALLAADPVLKIADSVSDPERFLRLDDTIMNEIEKSRDPRLAESQTLFRRLRKRELYRCVDYKMFKWHHRSWVEANLTADNIVEAAKALPREQVVARPMTPSTDDAEIDEPDFSSPLCAVDTLKAKDIIVDIIPMHHGMKEKNPLDSVKFYSKHKPDECAPAGPGDISSVMPTVFAEILVRIYTRDPQYYGIIQAGYNAILQNGGLHDESEVGDSVSRTNTPTLPDTIPTTGHTAISPSLTDQSPSTPGSVPGAARKRAFGRVPSFSNNPFTAVPPSYVPPTSPSAKPKSLKRGREPGELQLAPLEIKKRRS